MSGKLRYSQLLNDILEKNTVQCLCSTKYMSSLQPQKAKAKDGECQFGPNCEFFSTCKHNKDVCTCKPRCTCEPSSQKTEIAKEFCTKNVCDKFKCICVGTCLCKSEESLTKAYKPLTSCEKSVCICAGTCQCKSDESLSHNSQNKWDKSPKDTDKNKYSSAGTFPSKKQEMLLAKYNPPTNCDKSICVCGETCLCESEESTFKKTYKPSDECDKSKYMCGDNCLCKPEESFLNKPCEPSSHCDKSVCICGGICLCKSEESVLNKSHKPPTHCDDNKCICSICICQNQHDSKEHLFPSSFRNIIKNEAFSLMTDDRMKKECAEIKKCITDHKENMKIELEKNKPQTSSEQSTKEVKPSSNSKEEKDNKAVPTSNNQVPIKIPQVNENKVSLGPNPVEESRLLSPEYISKKNGKRSNTSVDDESKRYVKRHRRSHRKIKPLEEKQKQPPCSVKSKSLTYYSCGRTIIKSRPPYIRYYYSGDTDHYGVKMGHKHCLDLPQLVPKNMGWLWNIEDPGKGIRERKGWPPGFIGKNIKNMIKVMKKFSEDPGSKKDEVHSKKWQTVLEVDKKFEHKEEPPLIHIHKKGRVYNITFCPKNSDDDIGPIPIPFSITQKKHDSDTESSESTLEFELHSPKPRRKPNLPKVVQKKVEDEAEKEKVDTEASKTEADLTESVVQTSITAKTKKKPIKKKSDENKNLWEDQPTQVQKITEK
ncbi:uncharacterized protein LOC124352977 [Homalodisca vitripennis]|uniref:uncharacterized protein LOC124352977 n=1 Tax=Homalodisca vitripennis TaxID=197043 RepID=UPI001EEC9C43|nr:uncharacterized protein LOC124352977 [Homalodisca vitripennis]KAG8282286.1 hypothetical protein J6590_039032 [Homalodisca vitripennis]